MATPTFALSRLMCRATAADTLKKAFSEELTKDWRKNHPEMVAGENSAEKLLEKSGRKRLFRPEEITTQEKKKK